MKLLVLSGTPKTSGITYSFVTTAEMTAKEEGIECKTLHLVQLDLKKCKMCGEGWGICFNQSINALGDEDGFYSIQKMMREAGAFVYISPVHWGEISEDFKIFLDKLRRCRAAKQWDGDEEQATFLEGKPSILVAVAGGGGGGILSALMDFQRAIEQMNGDQWPREHAGIFDYITVNSWNQSYKREAFVNSLKKMFWFWRNKERSHE